MDLNLAWLRSWLEVVDSGGFARAAPRLHLSQPRISAHVASLERALGCELIDRRARPLALTEEGKRLLPKARAIVSAVDDTVSDMTSTATALAGRLTIASFASASDAFLPGVLKQLRTANPMLEIAIIDGDVKVIESRLSERQAAVAVRPYRPDPADPALVRRGLWSEPFVVLAPVEHPIWTDSDTKLRLEQIARHPVITIGDPLGDPILGFEALSAMHSSGIEARVGIVSHQPTTLAAMVRAGHGIGLVNLLAARMVRADGLMMREVDNPHLRRDVALWWHAERPLSRAAQAFVDLALASERPDGTRPITVEGDL
jgi:DNA-binding transcriptional LysR family regulator